MYICDDGHEEVCYEGRSCPLCYILEEKQGLIDQINEIENYTCWKCGKIEQIKQ
ncbi:MAG: hypothetical protein WD512_04955 [Candidatus Paceibacterota bacterium]